MLINGRPLVELTLHVEAPPLPPWDASVKELISLTQLYLLAPGTVFPLRYDPAVPAHIVIEREGEAPPRNDRALRENLEQQQAQYRALRATDQLAPAIVKKYTPLGAKVNGNNPYVELSVDVTPEKDPPFNADVRGVILGASVAKYAVGRQVYVVYDPKDLRRVSLAGSDKPDTSVQSNP